MVDNRLYQTTNTGKIQGCVDDIVLLVRSKFCGTVADIMNDRLRQVCTWCESERLKTKAQGVEGNYKMNPLTKEMVATPFTVPEPVCGNRWSTAKISTKNWVNRKR